MDQAVENHGTALTVAQRIQDQVLAPLKLEFVGKDEIIDLLGVCLVAGENLFLLGPPGTAKSAIVQSLARRIAGRSFDYLLTRFTEPSELFGPFDIRRLREGELLTNTEGMLPEADIVFLDELLNANSAILNSLLMALNERIFRRGRETRRLGVVLTVGASNRLPEDEALAALFDRFLLRVRSDNVPAEMLHSVLDAGWRIQQAEDAGRRPSATVSVDDVRLLHRSVSQVDLSGIKDRYVSLIHRLRHAGIDVSDRRAVKLQRLIAASALMCGRLTADQTDLWILRYIWDTVEQIEVLARLVGDTLKDAVSQDATGDGPTIHPRAAGHDLPDPEHLLNDLRQVEQQLSDGANEPALHSWLRDRLSLLSGRIDWIRDDEPREFLRERVAALLERIPAASGRRTSTESAT